MAHTGLSSEFCISPYFECHSLQVLIHCCSLSEAILSKHLAKHQHNVVPQEVISQEGHLAPGNHSCEHFLDLTKACVRNRLMAQF